MAVSAIVDGAFFDQIRVPTVLDAHPNEFDCELGPGSPSVPVMRLQIDLNDCHHENLHVDGTYGPLTMAAVRRAQAAEGLPASEQDGLYGPITNEKFWYQVSGAPVHTCDFILNT